MRPVAGIEQIKAVAGADPDPAAPILQDRVHGRMRQLPRVAVAMAKNSEAIVCPAV